MHTRTRPPRNRVLIGVAALAVGALVAIVVVSAGGSGAGEQAAAPGAATAPGLGSVAPGPTPSGPGAEPVTPAPAGAATPVDAVRGFVAGLGGGHAENAYRLMHPRYRAAFDSYATFLDDPAPTATYGPFAALGGPGYQSAVFEATPQDESVAVVSLSGEVMRDGVPVTEAVGMVARKAASGWLVEAGGEGGSVFQRPAAPGDLLAAGDDLVLWTPSAGLSEVLAVVGGEQQETVVKELVDPSETTEIRVGDHSPTAAQMAVGILREDGSVDTVATYFLV